MVLVDGVFEHVEHGHLDGFAFDVVFLDIAVGAFQHKVGGCGDIAAIGVVVFEVVGGINPNGVVAVTVVVEQHVGHGHELGVEVHSIVGFRSKDLVILEDEFKASSSKFVLMSDDGTAGEKGLVTDALKKLIDSGEKYDRVITIGPLIMMKFVCKLTKEYNIPTVASMNPIMIDGTGMCGGCRLTVGGETKFACVDGPEFDGHLIDFDEAMARGAMYKPFERHAHEEACNLFKEVK